MKTNGTRTIKLIASLILIGLLISISGLAQPDYIFKNPTLVSGADKKVGAKYLYKNVRPLTDCFVTITDIQKVTLSKLDGPDGYDEAFQPVIFCPKKTKGYVEFRFDFVIANTSIPKLMLEVPVTAIDIDGYIFPDEKVYEFDEFDLPLTYLINFDMIASALNIKTTGTTVQALNKTAVDHPGIDTFSRDVMFTMIYNAVTSITLRAGVDNKSKTDVERLRSDYFKKFDYENSILAKSPLMAFRGNEKNEQVNLQWELNKNNLLKSIVVEKATSPNQFQPIGEIWTNTDGEQALYQYTDNAGVNGQAYYRLKMVAADGSVSYSNILVFRTANGGQNDDYKVYPGLVRSSATVTVKSSSNSTGIFQLVDYSGRVVSQRRIALQEGSNNIVINNLDNVNPGNYVAVIKTGDNKLYSQKIVKQ